ncbi:type IV toxin-antitoxin system AbiEi family antitoxin [Paenibacillus sp. TRM 82003]|uniref:type IV toxin-antitoxin system AbiEi family antitoxin domain-containing protein n=1 Tax=Kineococcus sp. TRM81007 TaxID=2925831 RepID=UPI001F5A4604|nr:type IV toxin-antitoxin system AbiEi family antitoxin [Kineococcus sp. TRM81007]MCI2238122.1 type IV toxin-antitoxin system AbiEi family antitoxin [Kineococcus sp. TRM81007]MCI3920506.1 type IV toxin-antitoxin system AbiEi family antitoxin [Paenibacillus sp. TRM 82003]
MAALPEEITRAPLRTFKTQALAHRYTQPAVQLHRLRKQGRVRRAARGLHYAVPEGAAASWRPSLEALAAGVATALYGERVPVLMHLSAARLHGATPRALARAVVAVPQQHPAVALEDREEAQVLFVKRDTDALDAQSMTTDLGPVLVTGPEQTLLDLARRPDLLDLPGEVWEAVRGLWPRCDEELLEHLAEDQRGRSALRRARRVRQGAHPGPEPRVAAHTDAQDVPGGGVVRIGRRE